MFVQLPAWTTLDSGPSTETENIKTLSIEQNTECILGKGPLQAKHTAYLIREVSGLVFIQPYEVTTYILTLFNLHYEDWSDILKYF